MPEHISANVQWRYDYVEHYNLDEEIISKYLKTIWGNYKYFVEASLFRVPRGWRRAADSFIALW